MWQDSYGITKGQSILVNCPECVSREIEKKKKQLEADFKEAEEEGTEFRSPSYRDMEDEIDFEGLGLIMKLDPATKHFICKRCGLYATREQVSDIRYKLSRKESTKSDKQYDYLDWWQKSKKDKEA
tara:strand:- start:3156 stop:3533 length:378 start_codon:yes stop_codon:yes gene_type:complete